MRRKLVFLWIILAVCSVGTSAQSARNPLNRESASLSRHKGASSKILQSITFYRPDGTPFERTAFEYGKDGKMSSEMNQIRDKKQNEWQDVYKNNFAYRNGVKSTLSSDARGVSSGEEMGYDTQGRKSFIFYYSSDKSLGTRNEEPLMKGEWKYDEKGLVTEFLKTTCDKNTKAWNIPTTRILYSYDESGRQMEEVMQFWNLKDRIWENRGKYAYEYIDATGDVVCHSFFAYNNSWINDGKIVCSYDDDGDMIRCAYYGNQPDAPMTAYCVYAYAKASPEIVASVPEISVFPNPAVSYFELVVPEKYIGTTARLFDASGRQAKSFIIANAAMQVEVSGLSKGIYVLKVDAFSKKITLK